MVNSLRDSLKGGHPNGRQPMRRASIHYGAEREPWSRTGRWKSYNKKAVPRTTFNLRLNDYELGLLRWLAEERDESMQRVPNAC